MSAQVDYYETASDGTDQQEEVTIYGHKLMRQMAPLKLEAANRAGDFAALEEAIKNFAELGMNDTPEARVATELHDSIKRYEEELRDACDLKDRQKIRQVLKEIRNEDKWFSDSGGGSFNGPRISMYLRKNIEAAQNLVESLAISDVPPPVILAMDKKTMSELKSYVKPAPLVHRVMQAVFLLFSEEEDKTASWPYCQKLLVAEGQDGLNRKLMRFNADSIHPFIVKRVQKLLEGVELRHVQKASPGAATFFVWAMNVVSSKSSPESDGAAASTPSLFDTERKRLTKEQIKQRERAEHAACVKEEREIFSQQRKAAGPRGESTSRKSNYYAILR